MIDKSNMTSVELRKLNMYPDWNTDAGYTNAYNYVLSIHNNQPPVFPVGLNARQRTRYQNKFQFFVMKPYINNNPPNFFNVNTNPANLNQNFDLVYEPSLLNPLPNQQFRVSLTAVAFTRKTSVIQALYNSREAGYGTGINMFYSRLCMNYIGIKREDCEAFLKQQGDYNVSRQVSKAVNKPIIAKTSNERWMIDVLNMARYCREIAGANVAFNNPQIQANGQPYPPNMQAHYILVVVDCYSGFVWAEPLTGLGGQRIVIALNAICARINPVTKPHIIQTDNGQEFTSAQFTQWCAINNVIQVKTATYNPATNGKVERTNETLRQKMKDGFVRNNNLQWLRYLQEYTQNMNTQKKSRTKFSPFELYTPLYQPQQANNLVNFNMNITDRSSAQDIKRQAQANTIRSAYKAIAKGRPADVFAQNDLCRIKMSSIDQEMRQRYKTKIGISYNAIRYTPEVYIVVQVIAQPPPPNWQQIAPQGGVWNVVRGEQYRVRLNIPNSQPIAKLFFGSDLLKVPANEVPSNVPTIQRSRYINRFTGQPNQPANAPALPPPPPPNPPALPPNIPPVNPNQNPNPPNIPPAPPIPPANPNPNQNIPPVPPPPAIPPANNNNNNNNGRQQRQRRENRDNEYAYQQNVVRARPARVQQQQPVRAPPLVNPELNYNLRNRNRQPPPQTQQPQNRRKK